MIASLRGKLIAKDLKTLVVECGGVGFRCNASMNTLSAVGAIGSDVFVYTHMTVREDAIELSAFHSLEELECFKLLISVNGVSARLANSVLSEFTPDKVALSVAGSDAKMLTRASGVGAKLAQRIVLELREKIGSTDIGATEEVSYAGNASSNSAKSEAVDALVSLGFTATDASVAVGKLDPSLSIEEMIKLALKTLSRQV